MTERTVTEKSRRTGLGVKPRTRAETKAGLKQRSEWGGLGEGPGRDAPGLTRPVLPSYRRVLKRLSDV